MTLVSRIPENIALPLNNIIMRDHSWVSRPGFGCCRLSGSVHVWQKPNVYVKLIRLSTERMLREIFRIIEVCKHEGS